MNSCLFTFQSPTPTNCFAQLVWVLNGLVHVLGYRRRHDWTVLRIAAALTARVQRVRNRLEALIAAVRAGKPLPVRVRAGERRVDPKAAARRAAWREVWFGIRFGRGWLCPLAPVDAATLGGYLEQVLRDAEMRLVMAQDPRIGTLLRPMLRMLGGDERLLDPDPAVFAAVARVSPEAPRPAWASAVVAAPGGVEVVPEARFSARD